MTSQQIAPGLYLATIKAPGVYITTTGKTHTEAIQEALKEYFKPF